MALIGIAFSIAFLIGPMIGVGFSMWAKAQIAKSGANEAWFAYPAAVALALALIDLVYLYMAFKETLAPEKRLKDLKAAINQAFSYINPISLFSFSTLKNSGGVTPAELASLITLGLGLEYIYTHRNNQCQSHLRNRHTENPRCLPISFPY